MIKEIVQEEDVLNGQKNANAAIQVVTEQLITFSGFVQDPQNRESIIDTTVVSIAS